jgi:hypothetical protein
MRLLNCLENPLEVNSFFYVKNGTGIIYACFNYCLLILNYFLPKFSYSENIPANRFFGIIILALFYFSCSSPMDFNQVSDLKIEPVYVGI